MRRCVSRSRNQTEGASFIGGRTKIGGVDLTES